MRLVPVHASTSGLLVRCAACHRSVRAVSAFAAVGAASASYRCLTDALEPGTPLVLSLPVRVHDAIMLRRESRRLYATQGGEPADATIAWSLVEALHECLRSRELPRDLGLQVGCPTANVGVLAGNGVDAAWTWASRLDLTVQVQVVITDVTAFHQALDAFGPRAAYGDPAEYIGRALRAFLTYPVAPSTLGIAWESYALVSSARAH